MTKFTAKIPLMIRKKKKCTLREFKTLSETDRQWYLERGERRYFKILQPETNPALSRLEKKLKKYRVRYVKRVDSEFAYYDTLTS